jgi:phage shock protein A
MRRTGTPSRRRLLRPREPLRRPSQAGDRARADPALPMTTDALCAVLAENAALVRELARVQQRCTQWRDECSARTERLEAQLMRARARCIAKETQLAVLRDELAALRRREAVWLTNEELQRRLSDLRAHVRWLEAELAQAAGSNAVR